MASYLVTFYEALRSAIASAWPECAPNGIYRDKELGKTFLGRKAENQEIPFAVFSCKLDEGTQWGLTNRVSDGMLTVLYVAADDVSIDALTGKLETLRDALYVRTNLTSGQVIGYPGVADSVSSPALNEFMASVNRPFHAGGVTCRVIAGETAP